MTVGAKSKKRVHGSFQSFAWFASFAVKKDLIQAWRGGKFLTAKYAKYANRAFPK